MSVDTLDFQQAMDLLEKNPQDYVTPESLRELASRVSTASSGSITVLYGGEVNGVTAGKWAKAFSDQNPDLRMLDTTDAYQFLSSEAYDKRGRSHFHAFPVPEH